VTYHPDSDSEQDLTMAVWSYGDTWWAQDVGETTTSGWGRYGVADGCEFSYVDRYLGSMRDDGGLDVSVTSTWTMDPDTCDLSAFESSPCIAELDGVLQPVE
jgi:hypothetical protein